MDVSGRKNQRKRIACAWPMSMARSAWAYALFAKRPLRSKI
jgi:hypothetical protein